jgi:hypothetical protein
LLKNRDRLSAIDVVDELAVGANAGEREPVYKLPLPKFAKSALSYVMIASDKTHQFRGGGETITQNNRDDVKVALGDDASLGQLGSNKF